MAPKKRRTPAPQMDATELAKCLKADLTEEVIRRIAETRKYLQPDFENAKANLEMNGPMLVTAVANLGKRPPIKPTVAKALHLVDCDFQFKLSGKTAKWASNEANSVMTLWRIIFKKVARAKSSRSTNDLLKHIKEKHHSRSDGSSWSWLQWCQQFQ